MTDADTGRIRAMAERLAELRVERVRAASRACSALEAAARPLRDRHLLKLIDLVQGQLSRLLADRPDGDGSVSG